LLRGQRTMQKAERGGCSDSCSRACVTESAWYAERQAGVSFRGQSFPMCFQQKDIQVAGDTLLPSKKLLAFISKQLKFPACLPVVVQPKVCCHSGISRPRGKSCHPNAVLLALSSGAVQVGRDLWRSLAQSRSCRRSWRRHVWTGRRSDDSGVGWSSKLGWTGISQHASRGLPCA